MIRLQHDKQKQMRYGTLQKRDTLTLCLLKLQLRKVRTSS
ncbi:rpoE leader peptide RseD [Escherichia coli]|nr:rpoE leader peptide RseD [Escherichia coli]MDC7892518.1 rpoE leader peptide RseD [Escherichia coli]